MADRETPTFQAPIDRTGFALLVIWVGALQVMLDTGKEADWFNSPVIVAETAHRDRRLYRLGDLGTERQEPDGRPVAVQDAQLRVGVLSFCVAYAIFFGNNLLMPLWLQTNMGYVATWAGLVAAPSGVIAVIITPFAAQLLNRYDARILGSLSLMACSPYPSICARCSQLTPASSC
jgi:DHA2 family multidrug resistance protein